ncbi:MAG TPA: hypothetical protein VJ001_03845 [Rhodocyclaceae bacterium]|nr:hypothetical protein [Rhodocyclaceae bacterium]
MGIIANIVAAEEDELEAVAHSARPVNEWSGVECRGVDTAKIVTLHCLLTGAEFGLAVSFYEPRYVIDDGAMVLRLADEAFDRLATLDEEALHEVAYELAATEAFEIEPWDADEVGNWLLQLAQLAQLAESQAQVLFIWIRQSET